MRIILALAAALVAGAMAGQGETASVVQQALSPAIAYFDDGDALTPQARAVLDGVAENWRTSASEAIVLAGHTDATEGETEADAVGLSQRRANRVRDYLVAGGVPASSITTQAFGRTRPQVETPDREPLNRRVEITSGPDSGW